MSRKWVPWEGAFRAAGEGSIGIHHGSHVWTLEAAQSRRMSIEPYVFRSWVETYVDGVWKRVGNVVLTEEKDPTQPIIIGWKKFGL